MTFTDLHIHLLFGVDDGAEDEKQMQAILDAAYADGIRNICATPHFHPGYFGNNITATDSAFEKLREYAEKYSDLKLYKGNELRYSQNCLDWLKSGACKTINGSRYLLTDFDENADSDYIIEALLKLMNSGYTPILAHAERYGNFHVDLREIRQLQEYGVVIQVDAQSPFGGWGRGAKKRSRRLIGHYFVDIIASDAHNVDNRPPQLRNCFDYVAEKCSVSYAERIFCENPNDILNDMEIRKDLD